MSLTLTTSVNPVKACHNVTITATLSVDEIGFNTGFIVFVIDGKEATTPIAVSPAAVGFIAATITRKFKACPKSRTITAYYLPPNAPTSSLVLNIKKC